MTDLEKQLIKDFVSNKEMFEAVKKGFELAITESETVNPRVGDYGRALLSALNNEELGANLRARIIALQALEVGFSRLASYKPSLPATSKINQAR